MTTSFISTGRLKREPRYMKAVIGSVSILNLVQLGISVYDCVFWAANQNRTYDRFYEGTKADSLTPLLVGVMAFQVQGVYGWRAWQVSSLSVVWGPTTGLTGGLWAPSTVAQGSVDSPDFCDRCWTGHVCILLWLAVHDHHQLRL